MENIWQDRNVLLKGFWGWSPEKWASLGFTNESYVKKLIDENTDPFIVVSYITETRNKHDFKGKIVGFYLVSHEVGHRNDFTDPAVHSFEPDKWQHSLRIVRAFSFLHEYMLDVYAFDPPLILKSQAQPTAVWGKKLTDEKTLNLLRSLPYKEVPVYKGKTIVNESIQVPCTQKHKVAGGPINRKGYTVPGEPFDTEKELYALILEGELASVFLGNVTGLQIYKIGLSISPQSRLNSFQKSLPNTFPEEGQIKWSLYKSTRLDGHDPYPNFESALEGENAMKDYLGKNGTWLGGEFYAITKEEFELAWLIGRQSALLEKSDQDSKGVKSIPSTS